MPKSSASTSSSTPAGGRRPALADLADALGDQLDVLARERRIPVVGRQDALAAERVVGRRARDQVRVAPEPALAVRRGELLEQLHPARLLDEAEDHQLARGVDAAADGALDGREAPVHALFDRLHRPRAVGHDPRRRALEHVEVLRVAARPRDVLDRGGAGADRGDAQPAQVDGVVPARGMHRRPAEALEAREVRDPGLDQRPGAGDEDLRGESARRGIDPPALGSSFHAASDTSVFEPDPRPHAEGVGDLLEVRADLGLPRVRARPVRIRRERERVQVRRDVAGTTRIGVGVPRAAHAAATFENGEVLDARLAQVDRRWPMPEKPVPTIATSRGPCVHAGYITVTYGDVTCVVPIATRMTGAERREQLLDVTKAIVVAERLPRCVDRGRRPRGGDHAADRLRPLRDSPACSRRWSTASSGARCPSCPRPTTTCWPR